MRLQALYRGHGANVVRVVPEVLLKFSIHDQLRVICGSTAADQAQLPLSSRIAAGSLTGFLRTAFFHPLSVIRTRLTADMGEAAHRHHHHHGVPPHPGRPRHFAGMWQCVRETWGRERLRGFYAGSGMAVLHTVPYLAACFSAYEALLSALPRDKESIHQWWYPVLKMGCATGGLLICCCCHAWTLCDWTIFLCIRYELQPMQAGKCMARQYPTSRASCWMTIPAAKPTARASC